MKEIIIAIILGGFFGFALYNAGASNPENILSMLRLKRLILMKIIIFAIGFGAFLVSITGLVNAFPISHFSVKSTHLGVVIGGLIFGVGFGYGGTCPGTAVAGLGDIYIKRAFSTVLGGLLGAFVFAQCYCLLAKTGMYEMFALGNLSLFKISPNIPSVLEIGFGGLLLMSLVFMAIGYFLPDEFRESE